MKTVAVRNINRTPLDLVNGLAGQGASTVHEAMGRIGIMKPICDRFTLVQKLLAMLSLFWLSQAITGWCM